MRILCNYFYFFLTYSTIYAIIYTYKKKEVTMKFIHCADIHLGSKMQTNLDSIRANERKIEISMTFSKMIEYAKNNDIKVIVIAGDLFDEKKSAAKWVKRFLESVANNPDISFLYLLGNHDNNILIENNLDNLLVFSNEWTSYKIEDVTFSGIKLDGSLNPYKTLSLNKNDKNVVILHGQETKYQRDNEEVVNLQLLKNHYIDYLALGHIHSHKVAKLDDRGIYCYCGCLEGRGFDECGEKGFVVVDIDEKVKTEFVNFASRIFYEVRIDITNLETITDITTKLDEATKDISKRSLVKVILTGECTVNTFKDIEYLNKYLNEKFYFGKVYDNSKLKVDIDSLKLDISLKGEFIRNVLESTLDKETKDEVIILGLKALGNEEVL